MADTTFVNGTVIEASWLNDINDLVYGIQTANNGAKGLALVPFSPSLQYTSQSAASAIASLGATPSMFGAKGDGVTDDTVAMQAWASSNLSLHGESKTFLVSGQLSFSTNVVVYGHGMKIISSPGTYTNNAICRVAGSLITLPALSGALSANDVTISFASAHNLSVGDTICIYDSTDSSWSAARTYYRAGEYCRVESIVSSTSIKVWKPLRAGYASTVSVYKLTENNVAFHDMHIVAPGTGIVRPLEVSLATKVTISNVKAGGSLYTGISLDRCVNGSIFGLDCRVDNLSPSLPYAFIFGNSQDITVSSSFLYACRHAVTIGGDDFTCAVPNRNIRIADSFLANDSAVSHVPAADVHGNADGITYENCEIVGGGSFNGRNVRYINCNVYGVDSSVGAMIVYGSEWMGGEAKVEGGLFNAKSGVNYAYGIVRGGTSANATSDTTLVVKNISVSMGVTDTVARCDIVTTAFKTNAHVSNITILDAAGALNICRMSGDGGASTGDYVIVDNIANAPTGSALLVRVNGYTVAKRRLQRQSGQVSITTTATSTVSQAVTFPYSYDASGQYLANGTTQYIGAKGVLYSTSGATGNGCNVVVYTPDNTAFAAGNTITAKWFAEVSEL